MPVLTTITQKTKSPKLVLSKVEKNYYCTKDDLKAALKAIGITPTIEINSDCAQHLRYIFGYFPYNSGFLNKSAEELVSIIAQIDNGVDYWSTANSSDQFDPNEYPGDINPDADDRNKTIYKYLFKIGEKERLDKAVVACTDLMKKASNKHKLFPALYALLGEEAGGIDVLSIDEAKLSIMAKTLFALKVSKVAVTKKDIIKMLTQFQEEQGKFTNFDISNEAEEAKGEEAQASNSDINDGYLSLYYYLISDREPVEVNQPEENPNPAKHVFKCCELTDQEISENKYYLREYSILKNALKFQEIPANNKVMKFLREEQMYEFRIKRHPKAVNLEKFIAGAKACIFDDAKVEEELLPFCADIDFYYCQSKGLLASQDKSIIQNVLKYSGFTELLQSPEKMAKGLNASVITEDGKSLLTTDSIVRNILKGLNDELTVIQEYEVTFSDALQNLLAAVPLTIADIDTAISNASQQERVNFDYLGESKLSQPIESGKLAADLSKLFENLKAASVELTGKGPLTMLLKGVLKTDFASLSKMFAHENFKAFLAPIIKEVNRTRLMYYIETNCSESIKKSISLRGRGITSTEIYNICNTNATQDQKGVINGYLSSVFGNKYENSKDSFFTIVQEEITAARDNIIKMINPLVFGPIGWIKNKILNAIGLEEKFYNLYRGEPIGKDKEVNKEQVCYQAFGDLISSCYSNLRFELDDTVERFKKLEKFHMLAREFGEQKVNKKIQENKLSSQKLIKIAEYYNTALIQNKTDQPKLIKSCFENYLNNQIGLADIKYKLLDNDNITQEQIEDLETLLNNRYIKNSVAVLSDYISNNADELQEACSKGDFYVLLLLASHVNADLKQKISSLRTTNGAKFETMMSELGQKLEQPLQHKQEIKNIVNRHCDNAELRFSQDGCESKHDGNNSPSPVKKYFERCNFHVGAVTTEFAKTDKNPLPNSAVIISLDKEYKNDPLYKALREVGFNPNSEEYAAFIKNFAEHSVSRSSNSSADSDSSEYCSVLRSYSESSVYSNDLENKHEEQKNESIPLLNEVGDSPDSYTLPEKLQIAYEALRDADMDEYLGRCDLGDICKDTLKDGYINAIKAFNENRSQSAEVIKELIKRGGHLNDTPKLIGLLMALNVSLGDKKYMNYSQIFSMIAYFDCAKDNQKERYSALPTGSGKTFVLAMTAMIEALRGKIVSYQTTSENLTEQAMSDFAGLYNCGLVKVNRVRRHDSAEDIFDDSTGRILIGDTISTDKILKDALSSGYIESNANVLFMQDEYDLSASYLQKVRVSKERPIMSDPRDRQEWFKKLIQLKDENNSDLTKHLELLKGYGFTKSEFALFNQDISDSLAKYKSMKEGIDYVVVNRQVQAVNPIDKSNQGCGLPMYIGHLIAAANDLEVDKFYRVMEAYDLDAPSKFVNHTKFGTSGTHNEVALPHAKVAKFASMLPSRNHKLKPECIEDENEFYGRIKQAINLESYNLDALNNKNNTLGLVFSGLFLLASIASIVLVGLSILPIYALIAAILVCIASLAGLIVFGRKFSSKYKKIKFFNNYKAHLGTLPVLIFVENDKELKQMYDNLNGELKGRLFAYGAGMYVEKGQLFEDRKELGEHERKQILESTGSVVILTRENSRGFDLCPSSHVINTDCTIVDPAGKAETAEYIQTYGRTARAGAIGMTSNIFKESLGSWETKFNIAQTERANSATQAAEAAKQLERIATPEVITARGKVIAARDAVGAARNAESADRGKVIEQTKIKENYDKALSLGKECTRINQIIEDLNTKLKERNNKNSKNEKNIQDTEKKLCLAKRKVIEVEQELVTVLPKQVVDRYNEVKEDLAMLHEDIEQLKTEIKDLDKKHKEMAKVRGKLKNVCQKLTKNGKEICVTSELESLEIKIKSYEDTLRRYDNSSLVCLDAKSKQKVCMERKIQLEKLLPLVNAKDELEKRLTRLPSLDKAKLELEAKQEQYERLLSEIKTLDVNNRNWFTLTGKVNELEQELTQLTSSKQKLDGEIQGLEKQKEESKKLFNENEYALNRIGEALSLFVKVGDTMDSISKVFKTKYEACLQILETLNSNLLASITSSNTKKTALDNCKVNLEAKKAACTALELLKPRAEIAPAQVPAGVEGESQRSDLVL